MTVELVINNQTNQVAKGKRISEIAHSLQGATFSCLQGKCGKCLVQLTDGKLGELSGSEQKFLTLMGLSTDGTYRLLCQGVANNNVVARKC